MKKRFVVFGLLIVACYIAFGDQILASQNSTPESFITNVGRGVGEIISEVTSRVGQAIWG